jgi:transcriptional regulator with XRE-family HTH domain
MNVLVKFGKRVKLLRNQKKWSQEKLALKADIDRTYLPGIESGARNVSLKIIDKIAKALNVEIFELFK